VAKAAAQGQIFSEFFSFPCYSFHRQLYTHHPSPGAGTIGQILADEPSGILLAPYQGHFFRTPRLISGLMEYLGVAFCVGVAFPYHVAGYLATLSICQNIRCGMLGCLVNDVPTIEGLWCNVCGGRDQK
jgi:hypothetical protein